MITGQNSSDAHIEGTFGNFVPYPNQLIETPTLDFKHIPPLLKPTGVHQVSDNNTKSSYESNFSKMQDNNSNHDINSYQQSFMNKPYEQERELREHLEMITSKLENMSDRISTINKSILFVTKRLDDLESKIGQ